MSCRSSLATLNEKLTALEKRMEYLEARVSCYIFLYLSCRFYDYFVKLIPNILFSGNKGRNFDMKMWACSVDF